MRGTVSRWIAACFMTAALATLATGCADLASVRAFRAEAAALHEALAEDATRWDTVASEMPPDDPRLSQAQAQAAEARARAALVQAGIARLDEVLEETVNPADPLSETVGAAAPLLPMSVRGPALLAAAVVVVGLRAWRLRTGLASVARGLATAMREDEEFRACFARHANTFRSTQTPTAKRIVDETTGRRGLLTLPL